MLSPPPPSTKQERASSRRCGDGQCVRSRGLSRSVQAAGPSKAGKRRPPCCSSDGQCGVDTLSPLTAVHRTVHIRLPCANREQRRRGLSKAGREGRCCSSDGHPLPTHRSALSISVSPASTGSSGYILFRRRLERRTGEGAAPGNKSVWPGTKRARQGPWRATASPCACSCARAAATTEYTRASGLKWACWATSKTTRFSSPV